MELHLDLVGGIAGDMFVAAILDLRSDLEEGLMNVLSYAPMLEGVSCRIVSHDDGILTGRRFLVERPGPDTTHEHHHHAAWRDIRAALSASSLDAETTHHAIGIFSLLADAEARVHGTAAEAVEFHEVGAWDSIADIVAAAYLIAQLDATRWTSSAAPLGSGRVRTAHGILPVPAPATALLLEGLPTIDDGIPGERVTPTGSAILRYLCKQETISPQPRRLVASGYGFGTRKLPGISNCVRVICFESRATDVAGSDRVAVLEFEIDDQTGEDLAQGIENLRAHKDVLDVVQMPVFGKKGRMMTGVRILARPDAVAQVVALAFDETTTIGIRHAIVDRMILPREIIETDTASGSAHVKLVKRPSGQTAKAEASDIGNGPGAAERQRRRQVAEAAAKTGKQS
ncbi:LarC family nickel insertion protein [Phyllobacterium zundukense]|uniref:LarC family nickel insertion protein n=1 Tax=Phyllobacterium zundukense TaxID=1867719 RepID=A0ACD4CYG1_9HYPH|nr:LarC family nickel insertion protein [Phyllobacterium zundukense]UXN58672.1 LarC family nickel insertion protein [Phyllobacterium zundukense]